MRQTLHLTGWGIICSLLLGGFVGCGDDENVTVTPKEKLFVKGLFDLTGGTKDVSPSYSRGVLDILDKTNKAGGIRGHEISIDWIDYAYDAAKAKTQYDAWKADGSLGTSVAIFGWGTADSVKLRPDVAADQKPFISASYAGSLSYPGPDSKTGTVDLGGGKTPITWKAEPAPYNFFAGTDYSTAIRAAIEFIKTKKGGNSMAFAFCSAGYCTDPIPAGKTYASSKSLTVRDDLVFKCTVKGKTPEEACKVGFVATDKAGVAANTTDDNKVFAFVKGSPSLGCTWTKKETDTPVAPTAGCLQGIELADSEAIIKQKVQLYKDASADNASVEWLWIGNTMATTARFANGVKAASMGASIVTNVWGFDENLVKQCPDSCPGKMYGTLPFTGWDDQAASGMAALEQLHQEYRQMGASVCAINDASHCACQNGIKDCQDVRYIQGYVSYLMFKKVIETLDDQGKAITGPNIKDVFETLTSFDPGGLTAAPLHWSPTDHRPQSTERIYSIDSNKVTKYEATIAIEAKAEWLGW